MSEELLYTQEDIDEWMRACDELQVRLREREGEIKTLNKQLQKLEEREDRMSFIFYVALNKQFERAGMVDNIPSAIEQLVGAKCGKYAHSYTEYTSQKKQLAELQSKIEELESQYAYECECNKQFVASQKENAIYKRALELENEERFKNIDGIWMIENGKRTKFINNAEELTNYFLDQAKKELEERNGN